MSNQNVFHRFMLCDHVYKIACDSCENDNNRQRYCDIKLYKRPEVCSNMTVCWVLVYLEQNKFRHINKNQLFCKVTCFLLSLVSPSLLLKTYKPANQRTAFHPLTNHRLK